MSRDITFSVRSALLGSGVVVAVLAAYVVGNAGDSLGAEEPVAAGTAGGALAAITMTGVGEVTGVPDQLAFDVAVTRRADDVGTALDQASRTMEGALAALKAQGVERKDTQTTGLSMEPVYRYLSSDPPQIVGYRVRQSASVLVRDLRAGSKAIAAAVDSGGNAVRVSDIALKIGDREALVAKARDAAVEAATAKAEQYAKTTGQELGHVVTLKEGPVAARVPQPLAQGYDVRAESAADRLKAVPIRAGRDDLSVRVTIVWAFD